MLLDKLRDLRRRGRVLRATVLSDLAPFRHQTEPTFRRLPGSPSEPGDVSVTTTCTVLMTLALTERADGVYGKGKGKSDAETAFKRVMDAEWTSSGLPFDNAFTRTLVLRTGAVLASTGLLSRESVLGMTHMQREPGHLNNPQAVRSNPTSLEGVAKELAKGAPRSFRVLEYPPANTLSYWTVDAADRLRIDLEDGWKELAQWCSTSFARQLSLIAAHHETLMDPVAMAMAACTAARMRRYATSGHNTIANISTELPTAVELREGVRALFGKQTQSGIWPKYFPLFHYPGGGSNYTFSFELLEAVLAEFGDTDLVTESLTLDGLDLAIRWCESNRLQFKDGTTTYRGWNSGGQVTSLERGEPESWATGTVHMFLEELEHALSLAIDRLVLETYAPGATRERTPNNTRWQQMLDTQVDIGGQPYSVLKLLDREMIERMPKTRGRHLELPRRRSALLFGPPGTSKTSLVRAFADRLAWPFVELSPSHFLTTGLDGIYGRTNEIFRDLGDLRAAVVLFDEMDALVRRRPLGDEDPPLDIAREFLTTTMLPKLADLHDRGQVFYFMATNHREFFDDAVIRPGRFDMHIFLGHPSWATKLEHLPAFLPGNVKAEAVQEIRDKLSKWFPAGGTDTKLLDLFSFGETRALFDQFVDQDGADTAFEKDDAEARFRKIFTEYSSNIVALRAKVGSKDNPALAEYKVDQTRSRLQ